MSYPLTCTSERWIMSYLADVIMIPPSNETELESTSIVLGVSASDPCVSATAWCVLMIISTIRDVVWRIEKKEEVIGAISILGSSTENIIPVCI
jgi:hypothetical protein